MSFDVDEREARDAIQLLRISLGSNHPPDVVGAFGLLTAYVEQQRVFRPSEPIKALAEEVLAFKSRSYVQAAVQLSKWVLGK